MHTTEQLTTAMRRALELALHGPADNPNPQVGCVLIDDNGNIVSEGWHRGAGTAHAEIVALSHLSDDWRDRMHELTAVVTLEPCNHSGRTGPCAEALAQSGITRVIYGAKDPSPNAGGGALTLQRAGVAVMSGVLKDEAEAVIAPWMNRLRLPARPHVTVKWAQTLDGRAAAADGTSQWITGQDSRDDVHRRRAQADAIIVGTGTLLADDPALTARATDGTLLTDPVHQPMPVVVGKREIPADAQVRSHPALAAHGLQEPVRFDGSDLPNMMHQLSELGVKSVFVEGGPTLASAFIAAGIVDEVLIYIAPSLLGGPKLALGDIGVHTIADIRRLEINHFAQLGQDLLVKARIIEKREP